MEPRLLAALMLAATVLVASPSALGQTTSNGPYYALPSWDQQLPATTRFVVLANWNSQAVLDRETGLVWQRTPRTDKNFWAEAVEACRGQLTGNRRGWRLPTYEELTSLLDPTQIDPAMPSGHPFVGIGATDEFWTASTFESAGTAAWVVEIGLADTLLVASKKDFTFRMWCVRGGAGADNPR